MNRTADVRFGSKADICSAKRHVRFTPKSDIKCVKEECPLWAKSGRQRTTDRPLYYIRSGQYGWTSVQRDFDDCNPNLTSMGAWVA